MINILKKIYKADPVIFWTTVAVSLSIAVIHLSFKLLTHS